MSYLNSRLQQKGIQPLLSLLNVKDYPFGAKGDGATNDSAAIQAAINAAVAGQAVYLPFGTYIAYQLEMKSGVFLISQGATIKCPAAAINFQNCIRFNGVSKSGILGRLTLDGNYAAQVNLGNSGQIAVNITNGSTDIYLDSVYASGWQCDGLFIGHDVTPPQRISVNDYTSNACGRNGLSITGAKDVHFNRYCGIGTLNSDGTGPAAGLDIEPNVGTATIENIVFDDLELRNNVGPNMQISGAVNAGAFNHGKVVVKRIVASGSTTNSGIVLQKCRDIQFLSGFVSGNNKNGLEIRTDVCDLQCNLVFELNQLTGVFASLTGQTNASKNWVFSGSTFRNNSQLGAGGHYGAHFQSDDAAKLLTDVVALDVKAYDDQAVHTQGYGLLFQANTRNCKASGYFAGNTVGSYLDATGTSFVRTKKCRTTVAVNPGNIPANSVADTFAAVPAGFASAGDHITVSPTTTGLEAGLSFCAWAAGGNTVIIRLINSTTGAIVPANRTYSIVCESFQ